MDKSFPTMHALPGVRLGATAAGIRYQGRDDLCLIELPPSSKTAACFTKNAFPAAPVILAKQHLQQTDPRFLLINSGNANACTGEPGLSDAYASCEKVARMAGVSPQQVLPFSTGVIGEPLAMDRLLPGIYDLFGEQAGRSEQSWDAAASAILTTDTGPKAVSGEIELDGVPVRLNGIAKGSGMIRPDMATMLAYFVSDVRISKAALQQACIQATEQSFNRITVDGDTSTNDACVLCATGTAANTVIESLESPAGKQFLQWLTDAFVDLAQQIVADGEGATKFVTLSVRGGASSEDCLNVAYTLAHSPLIKTALYAGDPNWGRLVAALGRAGVENLNPSKVKIWLDEVLIVELGAVANSYSEDLGQRVFDQDSFCISIDLAMGDFAEKIWTCDLSHEYVSINAEYRS